MEVQNKGESSGHYWVLSGNGRMEGIGCLIGEVKK